ncbi:MAG TPA: prepilin-type N-terminal cleavage/methylation domain-containing protein [Verrucomicrobiae bacterium]|nr:prepilin-type N-terminal cleavage/methylation domain-containing protein [Verrucomicrobiae bacterium]
MRIASGKSTNAFTLIEIMIALVIFSTVIIAIYSTWTAILRSTKVGHDAAADVQRERIAVRALEEAILSVQMFQENIRYYSFEADTSSDFAALSFVARLPKSFPRSGNFGDQAVRRVTFAVEAGKDSRNELVLRQRPILFEPNVDEDENPLVLARNVKAFTVEFLGPRSQDWEPEWLYTNQLPRKIRFSLALGLAKGNTSESGDAITRMITLNRGPIPSSMQVGAPPR